MKPLVKLKLGLLCGSAWVTMNAMATFLTGTLLLQRLDGDPGERNNAVGYIVAIADEGEDASRPQPKGTCFAIPRGVPSGELAERVKKFLERNPAIRNDVAAKLVKASLSEAFPCRN